MHRPHKHTGPGKADFWSQPREKILLYNFGINDPHLKHEHRMILRSRLVPILEKGGSVSIIGLASRSGRMSHNQTISLQRAENVRVFLQHAVTQGFNVREFKAFGERKAKLDGQRDGFEDERYRSVVLFPSSSPQPPDPDLDDQAVHEIQLPNIGKTEGVLDTIGQILDVTSGAASIINLVVDAVVIDVGGVILAAISTIIGMPAAWLEANKFARNNGQKLGFSKAVQEMSNAYADYDLRLVPESSWKPLPHPIPRFDGPPDESVTVAERSARTGTREGYEAAWKLLSQMDQSPRDFTVNVKGKQSTMRLSGKRFLWLLSRAYKEDVWRKIYARF